MESWIEDEIEGCEFQDTRLSRRFRKIMENLSSNIGESIPYASQDWANTKAAYRFFSNERISEREILAGHFESTRDRAKEANGTMLVLHDTSEFVYKRADTKAIGITTKVNSGRDESGRLRMHTVCGILMHSSLVVTTEGLPLGLAAIKFWNRKKFTGRSLRADLNYSRIPIEDKESLRWVENLRYSTQLLGQPERCVHIGDRESDIYELFCEAKELGSHFLVRASAGRKRKIGDGSRTLESAMGKTENAGKHKVQIRDDKGELKSVTLDVKFRHVSLFQPQGKSQYPPVQLTVIYAQERTKPKGREKIDWRLLTDLEVTTMRQALEKLHWYSLRWEIETFHKILKSGCKAEESKLRTANRLVNLISVFTILAWRVFWLTMANRFMPDVPPQLVLTDLEIELLDKLVKAKKEKGPKKASRYLLKIACLGGYLARANDPPPGNKLIWKGLTRLTDIELGFLLGAKVVGN